MAGVSIATLTLDNGILTKAQDSKTASENATELEQVKLAATSAYIKGLTSVSESDLRTELATNGFDVTSSSTNVETVEGNYYFTTSRNVIYKITSAGNVETVDEIPTTQTTYSITSTLTNVTEDSSNATTICKRLMKRRIETF